jgi:hypothetical protein
LLRHCQSPSVLSSLIVALSSVVLIVVILI